MDQTCFYALYRHWEQGGAPSSVRSGSLTSLSAPSSTAVEEVRSVSEPTSVESSSELLPLDGTKRLELVTSDLDSELEEKLKLHKFVQQKVDRNLLNEGGSLGYLPAIVTRAKVSATTWCFYALLNVDSHTKYILCLISLAESNGLDLYVTEKSLLLVWSSGLLRLLFSSCVHLLPSIQPKKANQFQRV
jgi:hypothetical protein